MLKERTLYAAEQIAKDATYFELLTPTRELVSPLLATLKSTSADVKTLPQLRSLVQDLIARMNDGKRAIMVRFGKALSYQEILSLTGKIGEMMGQLLVQNERGDKVIMVYDRDRLGSMANGARYHQTREGGTIHTDNVNIPEPWEYLILTCLAPAEIGGENILVDGVAIHERLRSSYPAALKTLERNFYWEMRGVAEALYQAPIVTYNGRGEPLFRHLRTYMESAHRKANCPLTVDQVYALDTLDALTNSTEFQFRWRMEQGDFLFTVDSQILHGRTCFSDSLDAVTIDDLAAGNGSNLKRTMARVWIKASKCTLG